MSTAATEPKAASTKICEAAAAIETAGDILGKLASEISHPGHAQRIFRLSHVAREAAKPLVKLSEKLAAI